MESNVEKFKEAFDVIAKADPQPTTVAIVVHENPDLDCIGAALGMQKLLKYWAPDVKCTIYHFGELSHPQNKTEANLLNLQMVDRQDVEPLTQKSAQVFIVVDTLPERCGLKDVTVLLTIDHHKGDTKKSTFKDIRMVGSASSIVWEYLNKAGVEFGKNDEDADVATALIMGIKADTFDLSSENVTDLDFEAFRYLIRHVNQRKLGLIVKYPLPPYFFELRKCLDQDGNSKLESGVFMGGIGYIQPSKRDVLPTIADERGRIEGTDTSFVFAIVGDFIEISVRSNGLSVDVNDVIQNIVGKDNGGGKMGAGAGKVPMGFLSIMDDTPEIQEKMWLAIRDKLMSRISEEMSKHR